jgi:hypothetical protein
MFLIYNCSVHYWRAARLLQRDGVRFHLVPSMEQVVKALEAVPSKEEWKVQLKISLALCYQEANRLADAQKVANDAYMLASNVTELIPKVLRLQQHLAGGKPMAMAADVAPGNKARGIIQNIRTNAATLNADQRNAQLMEVC